MCRFYSKKFFFSSQNNFPNVTKVSIKAFLSFFAPQSHKPSKHHLAPLIVGPRSDCKRKNNVKWERWPTFAFFSFACNVSRSCLFAASASCCRRSFACKRNNSEIDSTKGSFFLAARWDVFFSPAFEIPIAQEIYGSRWIYDDEVPPGRIDVDAEM